MPHVGLQLCVMIAFTADCLLDLCWLLFAGSGKGGYMQQEQVKLWKGFLEYERSNPAAPGGGSSDPASRAGIHAGTHVPVALPRGTCGDVYAAPIGCIVHPRSGSVLLPLLLLVLP